MFLQSRNASVCFINEIFRYVAAYSNLESFVMMNTSSISEESEAYKDKLGTSRAFCHHFGVELSLVFLWTISNLTLGRIALRAEFALSLEFVYRNYVCVTSHFSAIFGFHRPTANKLVELFSGISCYNGQCTFIECC